MQSLRFFAIALAILPLTFSSAHAEPQCCTSGFVSWLAAMFSSPCNPACKCEDADDSTLARWRNLWTTGRFAEAVAQIKNCEGCDLQTRHAKILSDLLTQECTPSACTRQAANDCCGNRPKQRTRPCEALQNVGQIELAFDVVFLPKSPFFFVNMSASKTAAQPVNQLAVPTKTQCEAQTERSRCADEACPSQQETHRRLIAVVRGVPATVPTARCDGAEASDSSRLRAARRNEGVRLEAETPQREKEVAFKLTSGTNQMHIAGSNFKAHCRQISKSANGEDLILEGNVIFETTVLGRTLVIHGEMIRVDVQSGSFKVGESPTLPRKVQLRTSLWSDEFQQFNRECIVRD